MLKFCLCIRLFNLSMIIFWDGEGVSFISDPFWVSMTSNLEKEWNSVELRELNGTFSKHFWQQNGSSIFFWWILYSLLVILLHLLWLHRLQYGHKSAGCLVTIFLHTLHGPSVSVRETMLTLRNLGENTTQTYQKHRLAGRPAVTKRMIF